eukprot:11451639-Alexandrium_andersonii.AAC.1
MDRVPPALQAQPQTGWSSVDAAARRGFWFRGAGLELRAAQWLSEDGGPPVPDGLPRATEDLREALRDPLWELRACASGSFQNQMPEALRILFRGVLSESRARWAAWDAVLNR